MRIFRTRGPTTAMTATLFYVHAFAAIKTYHISAIDFETALSLPGVSLFNCIVIGIGLILMNNILPETEGCTLEDIEWHFADKSKKITDHKISKHKTKIFVIGSKCGSSETEAMIQ